MPRAVFSAYFDASGTKKEQRVLTVAGFVGRILKWVRFNDEWSAILASENVTAMHMTDFASSQGEYVSWKRQTERRRRFIFLLSECIKRHTNKGFASSVILSDYREVNTKFMLSEGVGTPYTLCARACLGALAQWARKKRVKNDEIIVAFEKGDQDQGELVKMARSDGFKVIPLSKTDAQAFQAGDMVAWKTRIVVQNAIYGPLGTEEDALQILKSLNPIRAIVQRNAGFDKEALLKMCLTSGLPQR